ncbi:MAG TPA: hypothetical protein VF221_05075 [Chloroflexota bacterium]
MARSLLIGARYLCVALILALAIPVLQPDRTLAAGETISVTPGFGNVGSSFTVNGTGFTTSTVQVLFNGQVIGTAAVSGGALSNALFQVPNLPAGTYGVQAYTPSGTAAGLSSSTNFTILGPGSTLANLSLSKFVQTTGGFSSCPNGGGCTLPNVSGATITYAIQYQNTANAPIGQLTITDTLPAGQTFVSASTGCVAGAPAPVTGLVTVTCTIVNVPASPLAGSQGFVTVSTRPVASSGTVLTNQACATEAGFVGQACSNTTYVTVTGTVTTGTMQLCGLITAYTAPSASGGTAGSITIGGQTFSIASNAGITGAAITTTAGLNNMCVTFTFVSGVATNLVVSSNLALANVVCGVIGPFTPVSGGTTDTVTVGGITFSTTTAVATSMAFVTGQTYCFLIQSGAIVGVLTGIPTAATPVEHNAYRHILAIAN